MLTLIKHEYVQKQKKREKEVAKRKNAVHKLDEKRLSFCRDCRTVNFVHTKDLK